jgi:uncharacterized protein (DUF433 family)
MAPAADNRLIGRGIYSVSEAARLARVPAARIRRWIRGYSFPTLAGRHRSEPIVVPDIEPIASTIALSFLDLQEVVFVDAFLKAGVSWKTMRSAHHAAEQKLGQHPFSTGRFATDGRWILLDLTGDVAAVDPAFQEVLTNQLAFRRLILPYLVKLDFGKDGQAIRWWPVGKKRRIVVDPERSFGQPIVSREGVPTVVLARAFQAERSTPIVARWYGVSRQSVTDAVKFEASLKAA